MLADSGGTKNAVGDLISYKHICKNPFVINELWIYLLAKKSLQKVKLQPGTKFKNESLVRDAAVKVTESYYNIVIKRYIFRFKVHDYQLELGVGAADINVICILSAY